MRHKLGMVSMYDQNGLAEVNQISDSCKKSNEKFDIQYLIGFELLNW